MNRTVLLGRKARDFNLTSNTELPMVLWKPQLAAGGVYLRMAQEIQQKFGNFGTRICYRFFPVSPQVPGAWNYTGTVRTADGRTVEDVDLTATTGNLLVQFGLSGAVSSGSAAAGAHVIGTPSLKSKARILAARTLHLTPSVNQGDTARVPLAPPIAAEGLSSLLFAFILSGVSGTLTFGSCYRLIQVDPKYPGAWTDLETVTNVTADTLHNTGLKTVTPGTNLLIQPGVLFAGDDASATMQVVVAAVEA